MRHILIIFFFISFFAFPLAVFAAAPQVQNLSGPTSGSKFTKMEWIFDLSNTYPNPYYSYDATDTASTNPSNVTWLGQNGISVDMHLTSPSGKAITVPAFWMEDYTRVKDTGVGTGVEVLGKVDNGRWHIRFAPSETGTYTFTITAQDSSGTTTSSNQSFTVTQSNKHGFIHMSSKDSRFYAYDDGTPFIPIGSAMQWWNDNALKSYDYENRFSIFGQNGVNLTRIWDDVDFALSIEGAPQLPWIDGSTVYGNAQGVAVGAGTANVHSGSRAANPTVAKGWYQRIAIKTTGVQHKLTFWMKTNAVSGGQGQVIIRSGSALFNAGTIVSQSTAVTGTTNWTQYSMTFTPITSDVTVNLVQTAGTGSVYVDDMSFGPTDASGNITYNLISDADFERHFANGITGDDPNSTPTLERPIGTYFNQWASYEYDKIVEAAENNGVAIQDCSCSGPWFTWPLNISQTTDSDYASAWILRYQKRSFRYKVARWGYSTAILAWEYANEQGHINQSGTPNLWNFFTQYSAYQASTDPYKHNRTTSQNSGAYSPGLWSSNIMDIANIHNYIDGHYPSYDTDDVKFVNQFAWCVRDIANNPNTSPLCSGLGLGDGTTWSGPAKPWVWGELGVASALNASTPLPAANTGTGGVWFLHNKTWAGLFSPLGLGPIEWWWYNEDQTATNGKFAATKAASTFFTGVDYDGGNFTYVTTPNEITGYTGETIASSNTTARVLGMRRSDKKAAYLWIQNRNHLYQNAGSTITPINATITLSNMLSTDSYTIKIYNTYSGTTTSTTTQTPTNGTITLAVSNLSDDIAVKIESTTLPVNTPSPTTPGNPTFTPTPTIALGNGDVNNDGKVDGLDDKQVLSNYLAIGGLPNDQYGDGKINSMDTTRVIRQMPTPTPTGSSQPQTITLQVASSSDDVNETDTALDTTSGSIWLGGCGSPSICDTGIRFTNIQIPKGATIQSAHVDVTSNASQWLGVGYDLYAELSPNSTAFSTSSKPSQRTVSTNKATVSDDVSWTANTTYSLPDMAQAIQEVVNQSSWQSGNALAIIAKATTPSGFGRKFITSFDGGATSSPKLIITYLASGTGVSPTNTPAATNTPTPSGPTPTGSPVSATEWTQFGGNVQHTNFTLQTVPTPWKYVWQWNGADSSGKHQASHLDVPDLMQPITGGGKIYIVAANTLFALNTTDGSVIWNKGNIGTLTATPVYDNGNIYLPSGNNILYKLDATTGTILSQFTATGALNTSPVVISNNVYVGSAGGSVYAIDKGTMIKQWEYITASPVVTTISYSPSKNTLVFVTQDLNVHAVNATSGSLLWKKKPTPRVYQSGTPDANGAQADNGWPVIAEQHGIVFVRYRLDWNTLWTWNPYPTTNSAIKSDLQSQPGQQALFALNLTDGSPAFIPAVGNGGAGDGGTLPMGPQPIVSMQNGQEVVYIIWRNGLTCAAGWCDGREDATMGEMVLDNTSVSGYTAGDVRFVQFQDIQSDEMLYLTMSGQTIFHNHWLDAEGKTITDRSAGLGSSFTSPIKTSDAPNIIWRQVYCDPSNSQCNPVIYPGGSGFTYGPSNCPFDAIHRYCSAGLYSYGDQRGYPPGFYEYWNDYNPNANSNAFTIISNNLVLVKTNDGALIVLQNGNPLAKADLQKQLALARTNSTTKVLGAKNLPVISFHDAKKYVGNYVTVEGKIAEAVNHLPKAMYLGFTSPHDGSLLLRVFAKDLKKFPYSLTSLKGKTVRVTGFVTLYWPEGKDPEIILSDPKQIEIK